IRLAALHANDPYEPLSEYTRQCRYETVGIYSHVQEAADNVKDVVGVHSCKYEMAGKRRLDRDLRSLGVADLAHHDLVRIVPKNGAQPAREGQSLLLVDGNLQHARQLVLDRIFDRYDLVAPGLRFGNRPVQGRRLAAAGRPRHEQHPVGKQAQRAQLCNDVGLESEHIEAQPAHLLGQGLLVEHAQHRILAEDAGNDRDAKVDRPRLEGNLEAPVLGYSALRDVELRHHFDARDDLLRQLDPGDVCDVGEYTVDPVAHHETRGS